MTDEVSHDEGTQSGADLAGAKHYAQNLPEADLVSGSHHVESPPEA